MLKSARNLNKSPSRSVARSIDLKATRKSKNHSVPTARHLNPVSKAATVKIPDTRRFPLSNFRRATSACRPVLSLYRTTKTDSPSRPHRTARSSWRMPRREQERNAAVLVTGMNFKNKVMIDFPDPSGHRFDIYAFPLLVEQSRFSVEFRCSGILSMERMRRKRRSSLQKRMFLSYSTILSGMVYHPIIETFTYPAKTKWDTCCAQLSCREPILHSDKRRSRGITSMVSSFPASDIH